MNTRAQMRMSRRAPAAPTPANRTQAPSPAMTARAQQSRVREVVTGSAPGLSASIPVSPATTPIPRTHLRVETTQDLLSHLAEGFSGLQTSLDRLTTTIRQANGLDAADQELDELRQANAALQAEIADLRHQLTIAVAPAPAIAHLADSQLESVPDVDVSPESA